MSSELLNIVFAFPPDEPEPFATKVSEDRLIRSFVQQLSTIPAQHWLKGADTPQDILELLNPTANTLGYTYALQARIQAAGEPKGPRSIPDLLKPGGSTWNKIELYLEKCDPVQIRYVGGQWRSIVEYVERVARALGSPALAIAPIRSAMMRLDPTTGTFTSTHLNFIRLCMDTRSYTAAVPILDNYIHSLPSRIPRQVLEQLEGSVLCADHTDSGDYIYAGSGHSDMVTVQSVQEYYVLGAMAYIGLRQWKKAMQFLEHVLVTPTNGIANGLMLEAYRKWVLVSCLATGSLQNLPRTANGSAMKSIRGASKAYEALAEAFSAAVDSDSGGPKAIQKLRSQANRGAAQWTDEANAGLVRELLDQQYRVLIAGLASKFAAIPFKNVSEYTGISIEELVAYVEKLINDGELNARIDRLTAPEELIVLRFFLDPTQGPLAKTEKQQQVALLEQTQRTTLLASQVKGADFRLSLTKEYTDHVKRVGKKPQFSEEAMDTNWDEGLEADEDMMADLH
ncbi:hypothetical protein GQ43DRAFT_484987 [Delitschia confertaspora ATCC 74209]|uniref:COP9 signalosome complex subunit 3 n=1 Tax=Delitschia confertaspora ATCC 74209 TaxID=1513339 RepID=A0A9P4JBD4_9PLEO|nr:hypothetical protein GQ43DRAFT_484987 [Delitschia confertaspora ATCC 74209]